MSTGPQNPIVRITADAVRILLDNVMTLLGQYWLEVVELPAA